MPPEPRLCACGCGYRFLSRNPAQRYAHPSHRPPKQAVDAAHKAARAALLRFPPNGAPCPRCGKPMTNAQWAARPRLLDAGHTVDRALGGTVPDRVEHAWCNRAAGATLGNRLRSVARHRTSRVW